MATSFRRLALAYLVAGTARSSDVCAEGDAACAAEDEASLIQFKPRPSNPSPSQSHKYPHVQCPGSDSWCSGNQCCPGVHACGRKSFPCPTADKDFDGCATGHDGLVAALLDALTREEKYTFLRGVGWVNGTYDTMPGYYVGNVAHLDYKYGIPPQNQMDNGQGFRTVAKAIIKQVTSWPVTLSVASSWSEKDNGRWAEAMGKEFRTKGANVILGPGVNFHRNALGGRNAEYVTGESAYFGGRMVKPWVKAVQKQKVLAVVKHVTNNQQETNRDTVDAIVDARTQWQVYHPAFQSAIDAGVASAMCAYNLVNGEHACGNGDVLVKDFRNIMGFDGFVMSDWWAMHSFDAVKNGVNQEQPGDYSPSNDFYSTDENLATLSMDQIDDQVRPQLMMMLKYGLFEPEGQVCTPPACNESLYEAVATNPEHQALNRELAVNALLMLKNENDVLPLKPNTQIIVLGSACNASQDVDAQLAAWDLGSYYNIGGSGRVIANDPVTILKGLKKKCRQESKSKCKVVKYLGDNPDKAIRFAMNKAQGNGKKGGGGHKGPSVAFVCGGTTSTEGHDRKNLEVDQQDFIVKVADGLFGDIPTVSLTMTPGAILMPWTDKVDGILNIFLAGSETGTAFAEAIFGTSNPSAKSPITFPSTVAETIPPCQNVSCPYSEGLNVGYVGLVNEPVQFPFGHGLSYTTFAYENLQAYTMGCSTWRKVPDACKGAQACFTARITNTGSRAGVDVAQLYMDYPESADEPDMQLRGFVRTELLKPQESVDIAFPLYERDFQIWNEDSSKWSTPGWSTPNGKFKMSVGSSSRDIKATSGLTMRWGKPYAM